MHLTPNFRSFAQCGTRPQRARTASRSSEPRARRTIGARSVGRQSGFAASSEFEAYLECGILAHGFLRPRCGECTHEKLVAFSCKPRGFCLSCGARRMAETAAYLVDRVIPRVPVRQWVVSFPIPLRVLCAAHPELLTPVLRIVHRVITSFLLSQAGLKRTGADAGAITLIQRFGSAANLNVHLHCLVLDGVYRRTEGEPSFDEARAPLAMSSRACSTRSSRD